MTAFDPQTETPPAIDALEKNICHNLLLLHSLYGRLGYQELPGALLERVCDMSMISAADGSTRLIFRVAIALDPTYATSLNQKLWTFAQPFGEATIPATWKTDS